VYLVTVALLPIVNFLVLRGGIFHAKASTEADDAPIRITGDQPPPPTTEEKAPVPVAEGD